MGIINQCQQATASLVSKKTGMWPLDPRHVGKEKIQSANGQCLEIVFKYQRKLRTIVVDHKKYGLLHVRVQGGFVDTRNELELTRVYFCQEICDREKPRSEKRKRLEAEKATAHNIDEIGFLK